jgi:hypothetical protein
MPARPGTGQELGQRRQHLLGSLLGSPVAGALDDHALHVVRGGLDPVPDLFTPASAPPIARTGIVSGRLLRCSFCARVVSQGAIDPKLARRTSGSEKRLK